MSKLNKDVLILILEELENDIKSLYSCLLVNKTWCKIIVPILWKNFLKNLKEEEKSINIILSHLSNEVKENLKDQGINLNSIILRQIPLFDYISFCKYFDLFRLENIFSKINNIEETKISIIKNEILKLFINRNTMYTYLFISQQCNLPIHLIPDAKYCFSELKFLHCYGNIKKDTLKGLARISKSIKKLILEFSNNNSGAIKLIDTQKNLCDVIFNRLMTNDESFCKVFEELLIKHVDTIKYLKINWMPVTRSILYLVNLKSLEIDSFYYSNWTNCSYLENLSLPSLKFLKVKRISSKILVNLIENTRGLLTDICIDREGDNNKDLIQAIYENCPKLKYLKLIFNNYNILELKNLLINCQYLSGLIIILGNELDWNNLFKILTDSSPINLYKFKIFFTCYKGPKVESLELFFENWKGKNRNPMLLQTSYSTLKYFNLTEKYKAEGIIKKYYHNLSESTFENFEWFD
ncbi:hypothetical protein RhiirA4_461324 [Rhizophagus irregularis]|uniref:F-box domain-containing protein n=1 Tax=Rhizophagus irregularis TaxID=588596 RepID=A0A2I1GIP1_9GLOM|nr:hypothetical protein RhiirA4_461324 [Rhizophagus irregularis]